MFERNSPFNLYFVMRKIAHRYHTYTVVYKPKMYGQRMVFLDTKRSG